MFAKPRPKKSPLPPAPSKKRKATHAIEEITFDNSARAEYLTGFHKRKVQRQKHAQEEAAKRAREERIELRKQIRDERKQAVEDHVKSVESMLKEAQVAGLGSDSQDEGEEEGEWGGIDDGADSDADATPNSAPVLENADHEEEYIDEDLYTSVKVEAVSIDRDGLHNKAELEGEGEEKDEREKREPENTDAKKEKKHEPKKKKKKFRYESKLVRQATDRKNRAAKGRR